MPSLLACRLIRDRDGLTDEEAISHWILGPRLVRSGLEPWLALAA